METIKIIVLLYFVSFGGMYYVASRYGRPPIFPGDLYRVNKAGKMTYFPFGGSFALTLIFFVILKLLSSKFGS